MNCEIIHIITSIGHNFVGHFGQEPGTNPAVRNEQVHLIAGKGIAGDRYAKLDDGHRKQITFFDMATIDLLKEKFGQQVEPELVRRNVFVRGLDLPSLVDRRFKVQGIEFLGIDPCPPCDWMDKSVGDGARALMEGRAGLRAQILTDGILKTGPAEFELLKEEAVS